MQTANGAQKNQFDLIILGGGVVGLTLALLCANNGFTIALVEATKPLFNQEDKDCDAKDCDARVSSINLASAKVFQTLEVWDDIQNNRISPFHSVMVWDALGYGEIEFTANEIGQESLGYIIENRVLLKALWGKVKNTQEIQCFPGEKPNSLEIAKEKVSLVLENAGNINNNKEVDKNKDIEIHKIKTEKPLSAKLIIGCDGANSWLREQLSLPIQKSEYQQKAISALVTHEFSHQQKAMQRFLPEGPLAFLPLADQHMSSIVWTSTQATANELLELPGSEFCQAIAKAFDYKLGNITEVSFRQAFPLKMLYAKKMIGHRAVIIGDAAHVIHPLAGLGVNLGLRDAEVLAEVLLCAKDTAYNVGEQVILRRFERARKEHIMAVIVAMEFFKRSFSGKSTSVAFMRSIGLNFINKMEWLKKKIIWKAINV